MSRPTSLTLLLALTTYPAISTDPGLFGWATADEVAHQLRSFGFSGITAQHVARPLRDLATGGEPILRYLERRDCCGVWAYRITEAGTAHVAEKMLWARGSYGKGYRREVAVI